ncbi:MAG: cupin fold metalloprotein, WbuC family [Lachnospiraceae bacterium]|nr:cupin fold metalloprotein, WbuC family [Lachnospiraceae bacterium]
MENEVEFNQDSVIKINKEVIGQIKEKAAVNSSGKFRLCLQHSAQDKLHEMLIVHRKGDYFRPDKHLYTTESHIIMDGAMMVVLFEDNGDIKDVFELSEKCYRTYRVDTNIYHMQIPLTEQVVYYEVKLGPFDEKSNIFPEWAPAPHDREGIVEYMDKLEKEIKKYRKRTRQ